MTIFNPENKKNLTYGECLHPAMKITDEEDAKQYLQSYIEYLRKFKSTKPKTNHRPPEEIAKINLKYFAGYYDKETYYRVIKLFIN